MKYAAVLFFLLLAGCAGRVTYTWQHDQGLDAVQLARAQPECRDLAYREARFEYFFYRDPFYPLYRPFPYYDRYYPDSFFWHDHYRQIWYQEDLSRLYHICMEAKGWQRVRTSSEQIDRRQPHNNAPPAVE
jgi:hypothetical protein